MTDPARPPSEILDPLPEPVPYDANRRPSEIEADIARTRVDLGETLDALERKLAPRQLLEKGVDMLRNSMNGNLGQVGDTLRANPIPLALIAGGLGWLLLARSGSRPIDAISRSRVGEVARRASDLASDAADRIKDRVRAATSSDPASDRYAYARPKPRTGREDEFPGGSEARMAQTASSSPEMSEEARRARSRLSGLLDEHPLAVGALGFLAGAALALALPATRLGDGTLGEARDRLLDEAKRRVRRATGAMANAVGADDADGGTGTTRARNEQSTDR